MIATIALVTLRGLFARRRILLMLLLAAVPVAIGLLARLRGLPGDPAERTAEILELLVVRAVLPIVALVLGTAALGAELEDGTAFHLLTRPVARWRIALGKVLAAAPAAAAIVVGSTLATGLLVGGERGSAPVTVAFAVAVAIGAVLYVLLFVALSVWTSRALVVGLAYVIIWEGTLSGLFEGTKLLSIREYTMAFAAALSPDGPIDATRGLEVLTAAAAAVVVAGAAFGLTVRRLGRIEFASGD